jgi:hypothetical protein
LALVGADDGRYDPPQRVVARRGFSRMSKVKMTAWVDESTASTIKGLATQHGVSVSEMCARLLRRGIEEDAAGGVGAEVLVPAVRASVRREVGRMSDRLAQLLARSALESAAARRVVYQLLVEELGPEDARRANEVAWTRSVESLKKPARGLREILEEASEDGAGEDRAADARPASDE